MKEARQSSVRFMNDFCPHLSSGKRLWGYIKMAQIIGKGNNPCLYGIKQRIYLSGISYDPVVCIPANCYTDSGPLQSYEFKFILFQQTTCELAFFFIRKRWPFSMPS